MVVDGDHSIGPDLCLGFFLFFLVAQKPRRHSLLLIVVAKESLALALLLFVIVAKDLVRTLSGTQRLLGGVVVSHKVVIVDSGLLILLSRLKLLLLDEGVSKSSPQVQLRHTYLFKVGAKLICRTVARRVKVEASSNPVHHSLGILRLLKLYLDLGVASGSGLSRSMNLVVFWWIQHLLQVLVCLVSLLLGSHSGLNLLWALSFRSLLSFRLDSHSSKRRLPLRRGLTVG